MILNPILLEEDRFFAGSTVLLFLETNKGMTRRKTPIKYIPDAIQHIYQRALDKGVIFYTDEDRIVYYTTAAAVKRKYDITVCASSLMFTHMHHSVKCRSLRILRKFLQDLDSTFARAYNKEHKREGQLFCNQPGISQKASWKAKKTNIIYVFNNHVEKKICTSAVQERWSLLAYAMSEHPFSEPIVSPSAGLKRAIHLVNRRVSSNLPLKYKDLHKILPSLDNIENEQFIDYVIVKFALIDYVSASEYFQDFDSMMTAVNSVEGGEWNLKEDYYNAPDTQFLELTKWFSANSNQKSPHSLSAPKKWDMIMRAKYETSALDCHLERFFHLKFRDQTSLELIRRRENYPTGVPLGYQ